MCIQVRLLVYYLFTHSWLVYSVYNRRTGGINKNWEMKLDNNTNVKKDKIYIKENSEEKNFKLEKTFRKVAIIYHFYFSKSTPLS